MTAPEKAATLKRLEYLCPETLTNLWSGVCRGLELFEQASLIGNVQGMYVLTDGMPNHMCPKQGYVAKLAPMLAKAASQRACVPTIHTFGFGYRIRSDLMQSIAEVGKGNYAFIPDAGMIGTVFVHAVANLFTTLGTSATLQLETSKVVQMTAGLGAGNTGRTSLQVDLGNIQYGQSRDIIVRSPGIPPNTVITAALNLKLPDGTFHEFHAKAPFSEKTSLAPEIWGYHMCRWQICDLLASLFPVKRNGEHSTTNDEAVLAQAREDVEAMAIWIKSSPISHDPQVNALYQDLVGDDPAGQILKALLSASSTNYWKRWGRHYLPSLLHAHERQMCNTFKDPGPLCYGKQSTLFNKCRDELDAAFDNLPAPKPSLPPPVVDVVGPDGRTTRKTLARPAKMKMSRYNNCHSACFQGGCKIRLANRSTVPVSSLKPGVSVWTPLGPRPVVAVLKTWNRRNSQKLCRIGELLVTPWHPVKHEGRWVFPNQIAQKMVSFHGSVYSILLAPSRYPDAHAVEVGGVTCVTLGHGVTCDGDDVRSHVFFGNYGRVRRSLSPLQADSLGHLRAIGLQRYARTGLVSGFAGPAARPVKSKLRAMGSRVRPRARRREIILGSS